MDERNQQNPQDEMDDDEKAFADFIKQSEEVKADPEQESEESDNEEAPDGEAQPPAQKEAEPEDWTASIADEKLRERVRQEIAQREQDARAAQDAARKFEAQWKAQAGQLAPVQRKLAELERQQKAKPAENPNGMSDAEWERYKRDFPEESRALESHLNPFKEQLRQMAEELAVIKQRDEAARSIDAVRAEHEDYDEIDNDPVFMDWVEAMKGHPVWGAILSKERLSSAEGSALIHEFKRDREIARFHEQQQKASTPVASPRATAVAGKREQQKRDIPVGNGGQSARSRSNAPVDPEEAEFAAFLAQNPP